MSEPLLDSAKWNKAAALITQKASVALDAGTMQTHDLADFRDCQTNREAGDDIRRVHFLHT